MAKKLFRNKYREESTRLQNWDYSWNGHYFVTICTKNRQHFFGEIIDGKMYLSEIGKLAHQFWMEIPEHFAFVKLGAFVVMPNHTHGIITIDKPNGDFPLFASPVIGHMRCQNQGKNTLSSIVGSYKSVVTKNARKMDTDFS